MQIEHRGHRPRIHPAATVAPGAVVSGDVTIGEYACVLSGAVVTAQGGPVVIGSNCVVMEQAVVRSTKRHPTTIGDNCLVGPHGYVTGATVEDNVFLATGSAVFNGAVVRTRAEVRIHGVVHVNTVLEEDATVPIGWVAVGNPAEIRPPHEHDEIWRVQETLDFPGVVLGVDRETPGQTTMPEVMRRYCRALAVHGRDIVVDD
jgi:carbonic anhydrase/acetyltransferase-like protein (isoleucine patch superfamily)